MEKSLEPKVYRNIRGILFDQATKADVCQTFVMLEQIKRRSPTLSESAIKVIGKGIREVYFQANRIANGCLLPEEHTSYSLILKFSAVIGLDLIFNERYTISAEKIIQIKKYPHFRELVSIYHNIQPNVINMLYRCYKIQYENFFHSSQYWGYIDSFQVSEDFSKIRNLFKKYLNSEIIKRIW